MSVEHIGKGYVKICVSEEELENSIAGLSQLKPILQTQAMKGNGRNTKQGLIDAAELGKHFDTCLLYTSNYGPSRSMASIHAEVPNDCDVERTHEIIDRIEREAMRRMGILLVIHMDPVETHDERVVEFKELVTSVLDGIDSRLTFHDFRMVDGVERINLIFDLVVPREYKPSVLGKLKARITEDVAKKDRRCCCVITCLLYTSRGR